MSSKGAYVSGSDGSDFSSRHVVENRYKLAANARSTLTNITIGMHE